MNILWFLRWDSGYFAHERDMNNFNGEGRWQQITLLALIIFPSLCPGLCSVTLVFITKKAEYLSFFFDLGFNHGFGKWNVTEYDRTKYLNKLYVTGFIFLTPKSSMKNNVSGLACSSKESDGADMNGSSWIQTTDELDVLAISRKVRINDCGFKTSCLGIVLLHLCVNCRLMKVTSYLLSIKLNSTSKFCHSDHFLFL